MAMVVTADSSASLRNDKQKGAADDKQKSKQREEQRQRLIGAWLEGIS